MLSSVRFAQRLGVSVRHRSYKDAFNKEPEVLRKMQEQFGLFVIDPEVLEREGIYLEQCLCYVNRAQSPEGDGVPPTFYFIFTFREPKGPDGSKRHTLRDWQYVDADGTQRKIIVGAEGKSPREMLLAGSVDNVALAALAKRVVGIFTEPYTRLRREKGRVLEANCTCSESGCCGVHAAYPKVLSEACPILAESVSIFDFSTRECLKESSVVGSDGALFLPVGDALQEVELRRPHPISHGPSGACLHSTHRNYSRLSCVVNTAVLARGAWDQSWNTQCP